MDVRSRSPVSSPRSPSPPPSAAPGPTTSPPTSNSTSSQSQGTPPQLGQVFLHGVPIVSLQMDGQERLCLAQISNTLLRDFSYNEIHNRRVALGITCVQCTPVQLEILRRAGAMPVSSRRCGMITRREAERLCKSFLGDNSPPRLPDDFSFAVHHECAWGCRGLFLPARYNSSRAKCIKCSLCGLFFSPNKFIFHSHRTGPSPRYVQPDAANFNSWRRHMRLSGSSPDEVVHAWEDVKAMFNGGTRKRLMSSASSAGPNSTTDSALTRSPSVSPNLSSTTIPTPSPAKMPRNTAPERSRSNRVPSSSPTSPPPPPPLPPPPPPPTSLAPPPLAYAPLHCGSHLSHYSGALPWLTAKRPPAPVTAFTEGLTRGWPTGLLPPLTPLPPLPTMTPMTPVTPPEEPSKLHSSAFRPVFPALLPPGMPCKPEPLSLLSEDSAERKPDDDQLDEEAEEDDDGDIDVDVDVETTEDDLVQRPAAPASDDGEVTSWSPEPVQDSTRRSSNRSSCPSSSPEKSFPFGRSSPCLPISAPGCGPGPGSGLNRDDQFWAVARLSLERRHQHVLYRHLHLITELSAPVGGGMGREPSENHPAVGAGTGAGAGVGAAVSVPPASSSGASAASVGIPTNPNHVSLPGRFIGGLGPLHVHRGHLHGPTDLTMDLSTDSQRFSDVRNPLEALLQTCSTCHQIYGSVSVVPPPPAESKLLP